MGQNKIILFILNIVLEIFKMYQRCVNAVFMPEIVTSYIQLLGKKCNNIYNPTGLS